MSSSNPAAPEPQSKPSEKAKPGDSSKKQKLDKQEEGTQKGEKRKPDPGKVTPKTIEKREKQGINEHTDGK